MNEEEARQILKNMNIEISGTSTCKECIYDDETHCFRDGKDCQMQAIETVLSLLEKKDNKIALLEQLYKELQNDFDNFKKDKDINYLDGMHHKKLVEKSIGQIIDKPEECWFDIFEVKAIKNNKLYGVAINEDFVTLKQISDESPEECITVIAESPLSGAIYRYNNYGDKKWQLIGTMLGYA